MVAMTRQELDSLDDLALIWRCIEPDIRRMQGKSLAVKTGVFAGMTRARRALLAFQMIQGHMGSGLEAFLEHMSYLLSSPGVWQQMKEGMRYFGDQEMLSVVCEMEKAYNVRVEKDGVTERPEIYEIEGRLMTRMPETARQIGRYIRKHPEEFVQLDG